MDKKSPWDTATTAKDLDTDFLKQISLSAKELQAISDKVREDFKEKMSQNTISTSVSKEFLATVFA